MEHKKFCPNCGENIHNFHGKFCPNCGYQIYEELEQEGGFVEKFSLSDEQKEQLKQKTNEIAGLAREKGKVYGKNLQTFLLYLWKQMRILYAFFKVQYKKYIPIIVKNIQKYIGAVGVFLKTYKKKIFSIIGIAFILGILCIVSIFFMKSFLKNELQDEKQKTNNSNINISNNQNTENSQNNSGNIVSENSSQTEAGDLQMEEKNLPTEYEVISEKSYFYTNPDDTEARKAYVMKGDKIIVNNEKSTENMIFAIYTNSSGKTTEGYLKKSEIKAIESGSIKTEEKVEKISNCKRVYDFAYGREEDTIEGYRKFEFKLIGDCLPKESQKISYNGDAFRVTTGQQAIFSNFMINSTGGAGGWCFVKNPIYSKKFQKNHFEIDMKGGAEYCSDGSDDGGEYSGDYLILIDIFEKGSKIITLKLEKLTEGILEENYNDLLWTMENGFSEKGNQSIEKAKLQEIHSVKWTKEKLDKWKFTHNGNYISFGNMQIATGLNLGTDCENEYFFGQKIFTECKVTKIDGNFIYWEYISGKTIDEANYSKITSRTEYNKTHILNGKTEKLKESYNNQCFEGDISGDNIPCP